MWLPNVKVERTLQILNERIRKDGKYLVDLCVSDEAVADHGIGLVRTVLSQDAISNGDLVRLSPLELPFEGYYYYVYQADSTPRMSAVHAFAAWLAEQFRQEFPELG